MYSTIEKVQGGLNSVYLNLGRVCELQEWGVTLFVSSRLIIPVTLPAGVGTLPVVYCAALHCITLPVLSLNKDSAAKHFSIAGVLTEFVDRDIAFALNSAKMMLQLTQHSVTIHVTFGYVEPQKFEIFSIISINILFSTENTQIFTVQHNLLN